MTTLSVPTTEPRQNVRAPVTSQARFRLLIGGALAVLLALIALGQTVSAYNTTYDVFQGIAEVNSTTVDSAERALQYLARSSQAAADYALLTSDTPLFEEAQNNIFRDFSNLRDELFILRGNLQTDDERTAFTVVDTFTENRFWRHVSNLLAQRSNDEQARLQYLSADNHVRNWINPALQRLENLNFQQMVQAGEQAGSIINSRIFLLAIPALALAVLLTYLSFELRQRVRRVLTPGIDLALILSWALLLITIIILINAQSQLHVMIQDAYRSVSGASRALVDANLANRAESSVLLDQERKDNWYQRFDEAVQLVELRMCGQPDCLSRSFVFSSRNIPDPQVVSSARAISPVNSALIDGIIPLVGNITFVGELEALERARIAFQEYRTVNSNLRALIDQGEIDGAIQLNTSVETGTSQQAFNRFAEAIEDEAEINRAVFLQVWDSQSALLRSNQVIYGYVGYLAVLVLTIIGVYHRYREL